MTEDRESSPSPPREDPTGPDGSDRHIPVGVSSCLLGQEVRFDGGHKKNDFVTATLAPFVRWIPVCPELEVGMGIPREALRLVRAEETIRLEANRSGRDWTDAMERFSGTRVEALRAERLRGFVLKKGSPTCGLERVRVYAESGQSCLREGRGLWAQALARSFPHLPLEEEGRLQDPRLRENFVTRIFAHDRWLRLRKTQPGPGDLVAFHTAHKMLLLAHSPRHYRELGPLVAQAGRASLPELLDRYEETFMAALSQLSTRGRHCNVLQHLIGYLEDDLPQQDRDELHRTLAEYRAGWVPLVTPLVLLRSYLKRLDHRWIEAQHYLDPYPRVLGLRSEI
ncbi:MAG: DUF1722 domain-containing protein [Candidatus Eisenbacteria bacterium]|uniref:DUF1722 domain-containing protein n=1 Tax=Eiseniibacteriota bacterium TaxID=2212470 RepID=A0A956M283_UNCEI|nr:DUF1722 domain-containing protein [Candidatus Eisenbacteria bacterium]